MLAFDAPQGDDRAGFASNLARREGSIGDQLFVQGLYIASLFVITKDAFEVA